MPNTYTQNHIHLVFAVQNRSCLIKSNWQNELYKYITAIIQDNNHKLLQINGMPDHIHILIGQRPHQSLADILKITKGESSKWINRKGLCNSKFSWQTGYGGFSYSKSQGPVLIKYIQNQQKHHKKISFLDEYKSILDSLEIEYDEKYIFTPVL